MLTRRKESNTYLGTVGRHRWSRQITMKIDKLYLSANTVAFISWRVFLFSCEVFLFSCEKSSSSAVKSLPLQLWRVFLFSCEVFLFSWEESSSSADENHSAGWKVQYFIYFHRDLSTPAMSTDASQVGVAIFHSFWNIFYLCEHTVKTAPHGSFGKVPPEWVQGRKRWRGWRENWMKIIWG